MKIKYFDDACRIVNNKKGNWIDLKSRISTRILRGEIVRIPLGIAMELPEGYEAHILPRSSTCKSFGIIQTNSMGIIDTSYCGNNDEWLVEVMAVRDTFIEKGDRIVQFRITRSMDRDNFFEDMEVVSQLDGPDRGGHGTSGKR